MKGEVTVGMPVYNGAATLRRAVDSILSQTYPVSRIHISDNASTDRTWELVKEIASENPKVTFIHHPVGLGVAGNFRYVLNQATTEYFMWLAADDHIEPTYVERTLAALEADPTLVGCVSRVLFIRARDGLRKISAGTAPLLSDPLTNLAVFLSDPHDNARTYSLYRTRALQSAFPPQDFHAFDFAATAGTLLHGGYAEVPEILMVRDLTDLVSYIKAVPRENRSAMGRLFPALPLTIDLVRRLKIPLRWPILKALVALNLDLHFRNASYYHPRYHRLLAPTMAKYFIWRLKMGPSLGSIEL